MWKFNCTSYKCGNRDGMRGDRRRNRRNGKRRLIGLHSRRTGFYALGGSKVVDSFRWASALQRPHCTNLIPTHVTKFIDTGLWIISS